MRPIFCANFEFETRQSDLERLFSKYGRVERVDMKSGFAFISMDDEQDAEDAIRGLDQKEFGRQGRRLRVDWTKQERGGRRPGGSRSSGNSNPTKTLFVINFDPMQTRERDLEKHFDPYGKILSIRIRRNFAFIQYDLQEDATKALDATNMSKLMDQVVSVEYAVRDDDGRRNRHSPDQRDRGRSPDRSRDRRRSPSSPRRQRDSPDYGHAPNSERSRDRHRIASPQGRDRDSPDYGHGPSSERSRDRHRIASPLGRDRDSPDYGHGPSSERSRGRHRIASPQGRDRDSPEYGGPPSSNTKGEQRGNIYPRERENSDSGQAPSSNMKPEPINRPYGRDRVSHSSDGPSSPNTKPERGGSRYRRGRDSLDSGHGPSTNKETEPKSPYRQEKDSPDPAHSGSPYAKPDTRHNPYQHDRGGPDVVRSPSPNTKYEHGAVTKENEHVVVTKEKAHGVVTKGNERDDPDFGPVVSPQGSKPEPSGSPKHARTRGSVYEKKHRSRSPSARKTVSEVEKKQKRELTDDA